jgi:hypothetical protein
MKELRVCPVGPRAHVERGAGLQLWPPGLKPHVQPRRRRTWWNHRVVSDRAKFNYTSIREISPGRLLYMHDGQMSGTLARIYSCFIDVERLGETKALIRPDQGAKRRRSGKGIDGKVGLY